MKIKTIKVIQKKDVEDDIFFWKTQTPHERLAALAETRAEYNQWKYGTAEPRLQRVYRVVKR